MYDFDAIVIGSGIVGNAISFGMAQQGFKVAQLGQDNQHQIKGAIDQRVFALSAQSKRVLTDVNIWKNLNPQRITPVDHMEVFGDLIRQSPYHQLLMSSQDEENALAWIVEQCLIQKAFVDSRSFVSQISHAVDPAIEHKILDRGVEITTENQVLRAQLLIGADGANSWVRSAYQIDVAEHRYDQLGVVGNFKCAIPHYGRAYQWFDADGSVLALLPLHDQQVSMVYSCAPQSAAKLLDLSEDRLCRFIESQSELCLGALELVSPLASFELKKTRAKQFYGSNMILIGDAAHTMHPLAGQGLNQGLGDVAAWLTILKKRRAGQRPNAIELLKEYQRARLLPTLMMQGATHGLHALFSNTNPVVTLARNHGLAAVNRLSPLKNQLIRHASKRS